MNDALVMFIITSSCACLLAILRILYKSKCSDIECGCIKIHRDVDEEVKYDNLHPQQQNSQVSL